MKYFYLKQNLKWLANKGVEGVLVNVHNDLSENKLSNSDVDTLADNFGATHQDDTLIFQSENDKQLFINDNRTLFSENPDGTFSYLSENGERRNISLIVQNDENGQPIANSSSDNPNISDRAKTLANKILEKSGNTGKITRQMAEFLGELLTAIPGVDADAIIENLILSDDETGNVVSEGGNKGAVDLYTLQIIFTPESNTVTVVHEGFHIQMRVNKKAFKELKRAFKSAMKDGKMRKKIEKVLDQFATEGEDKPIAVFHGRTKKHILEVLDNLDVDSDDIPKEVDEILDDFHTVWLSTTLGKYLPENIRKIFNQLAREIRRIYSKVTGKAMLPTSIDKAYSKFYERYGQENKTTLDIRNPNATTLAELFGLGRYSNQQAQQSESIVFDGKTYNSKSEFIKEFSNKDNFKPDPEKPEGDTSQVFVHNSWVDKDGNLLDIGNELNKLRKNLEAARIFSHKYGVEVFILPEHIDDKYRAVVKGKNPDSVTNGYIMEIKTVTGGDGGFKSRFGDGNNQSSDIIFIYVKNKNNFRLSYKELMEYKMGKSTSSFEGKKIVIFTKGGDWEYFDIKNGNVLESDTPWNAGILEASTHTGYQNNSDTLSLSPEARTVNDENGMRFEKDADSSENDERHYAFEKIVDVEDTDEYQEALKNDDIAAMRELLSKRMAEVDFGVAGNNEESSAKQYTNYTDSQRQMLEDAAEEAEKKSWYDEELSYLRENKNMEIFKPGDPRLRYRFDKLLSSDMLSGLNKRLSDYTPDEVALLIDNGIYVPDAILNSLRWDQVNATIKQEMADRKKIYNPYGFSFEVGLNSNENREIANGSATLDAF